MTRQATHETPEIWADRADAYEALFAPFSRRVAAAALAAVEPRAGQRWLDVGAGTGAVSLLAARRGARVVAVDLAAPMLDRLLAAAADQGVEGVEARVMDGQALDFADGSFDAAASNFGVVHFPDADRGLREMGRVLRPGGEAVVTTMHEPARSELLTLIIRAVADVLPGYAPPKAPSASRFTTVAEMTQALAQAGFKGVRVDVATIDWVIGDAMDFFQRWGVDAPPVAYMFEGLDARTKRAAGEAFARLAAARSRNGVASFPTEVVIGAGRR